MPKPTLFTRACYGERTERAPVWLMRQAGRYLPAYQALKERASFLELCQKPELAAQATLDAARILGTDAAIIFSDITLPGHAMGLPLEFSPGPRFANPVRSRADVDRLRAVDPVRDMPYVMEAIRRTRAELPEHVSLIGFCGAPLTLASYMVEGDPSKNWVEWKKLVYGSPEVAHVLLERVTEVVVAHARAQIEAGCDAVQLFDSHAGELAEAELHTFGFRYAKEALSGLAGLGAPRIYFARDIGAHLEAAAGLGAEVLGLDWTVSVAAARKRVGKVALQGNLDPTVLFTTRDNVVGRVHEILRQASGHPGFVMNLGHGVLPGTPVDNVHAVIDAVRSFQG